MVKLTRIMQNILLSNPDLIPKYILIFLELKLFNINVVVINSMFNSVNN